VHELSLALEVCRLAETYWSPGTSITAVGVEVGDDSGVELANFRFCLETLLTEPPFTGARAELEVLPGGDLRLAYVEIDDGRPND
jgi:Zn finger protein HypA/HybF involved in hydrogenase expression